MPRSIVLLAIVCGLLWAGWLASLHLAGTASPIDRLESVLLDFRILAAGSRPAPENVTIVAIDDETIANFGRFPLQRSQVAQLVHRIAQEGATALATDILFLGRTSVADDTALAGALSELPSVIAAAGVFPQDRWPASHIPKANNVLRPLEGIAAKSSVGLVNVSADAGGTPRHIPLLFQTDLGLEPSFGFRAVGAFLGENPEVTATGIRVGEKVLPLDQGWHLPLNYYGAAGAIRTISGARLLAGDNLADALRGRLVILGVTATGVGDNFATPFDPILPGVEVLATGISNILDGSALIRDQRVRWWDSGVCMLLAALGMIAIVTLPLAVGSLVFTGLTIGWLVVTLVFFFHGYWLSAALPLTASIPPVFCLAVVRQVGERLQMRRLQSAQEALGRFQAPAIARRISEDPLFLVEPKEQAVAVLFIDLAGYTGMSERLGPSKTRDLLKAFHTLVVEESRRFNGVVLDFMGDGAMIGFGVPDPSEKDGTNACRCALALVSQVAAWGGKAGRDTGIGELRVGGHWGSVVLSRLGHDEHQQIAVTGDCVNVASRLMDVGKTHHAAVTLSEALLAKCDDETRLVIGQDALKKVRLRGREEELVVAFWRT